MGPKSKIYNSKSNKIVISFSTKYMNKLIIIVFTLLYLLFPTHNSTTDAYIYAANVKWDHDLFFPHHLLYNIPGSVIYSLIKPFGFEIGALQAMKAVNAIVAGLTLYVFLKIVKQLPLDKEITTGLLLVTGSSFGFFRFATENEAYIFPIFLSVLSSYYFLIFMDEKKSFFVFLSGFFASMACLFHQIHLFWALGIFIGLLFDNKKTEHVLIFLIPALLVPTVYFITFHFGDNKFMKAGNLFAFIFYDYFYGVTDVRFNFDNIILGFINLIRSYVQVHGIIFILLRKYPFLIIAILFSAFFLLKASLNLKPVAKNRHINSPFLLSHLIIFVLQFAFAVFAGGNAEFMVMLPLLSLLLVAPYVDLSYRFYTYLGMSILIWNFSFAVFPNHVFDYQNNKKLIDIIKKQPDGYFILSDDVLVQNKIYYQTGIPWNGHIIKSPAGYKINGKDKSLLRFRIDSILNTDKQIFTDCIDEPIIYNRAAYLSADENKDFFKTYNVLKTGSFQTFAGTKYIYAIKNRYNEKTKPHY